MTKERLDQLLVGKNSVKSREAAKRLIMAGKVLVNGQKIEKAGTLVPADALIRILGDDLPFVSRGGLKLAKALDVFAVDLTAKIALDVGASTGGFTDCMLQNGAKKVYAVDVGYGQLAWKLRQDSRVISLERTNIRYLNKDSIPDTIDFASIDVAFISLTKVLPTVKNIIAPFANIVALIKPQFEAGRERVGKHGVVKDRKVHAEVIATVLDFAAAQGLFAVGLTFSPIKGPEGNIEYLAHLAPKRENDFPPGKIEETIAAAHTELQSEEH